MHIGRSLPGHILDLLGPPPDFFGIAQKLMGDYLALL
jgi:hypothetical protein